MRLLGISRHCFSLRLTIASFILLSALLRNLLPINLSLNILSSLFYHTPASSHFFHFPTTNNLLHLTQLFLVVPR